MQSRVFTTWFMAAPLLALPTVTEAQTVSNPSTAPDCMNNTAFFNPNQPPSINLPPGFTASVFAAGLNAPTGIAFLGNDRTGSAERRLRWPCRLPSASPR